MPHTPTPWIGLAAVLAMFVLPFLPDWLFQGPRRVKHWPRRHVCGYCEAPWTAGHTCEPEAIEARTEIEAGTGTGIEAGPPLRGELRRVRPSTELERRPEAPVPWVSR